MDIACQPADGPHVGMVSRSPVQLNTGQQALSEKLTVLQDKSLFTAKVHNGTCYSVLLCTDKHTTCTNALPGLKPGAAAIQQVKYSDLAVDSYKCSHVLLESVCRPIRNSTVCHAVQLLQSLLQSLLRSVAVSK